MRIGIAGLAGRMGRLLLEEVRKSPTLRYVGGTIRPGAVLPPDIDSPLFPDMAALAAEVDAVIDFTHPHTIGLHAEIFKKAGVAWILGTSGLSSADEALVGNVALQIPVVYAANFARGVTLTTLLVEQMAGFLSASDYDAEILEMHHRQKRDAPSGTAISLAKAVAIGRGENPETLMHDRKERFGQDAGPRKTGEIGFAALRGGQTIGDHTVLFASDSEHISITHRSLDRRLYASGAVEAALWLNGKKPGLYTMRDVITNA